MSRYTLDNLIELYEDAPVRDVAAALDLDVPGWHKKIDLDKLDMESGCWCVAGQVARSWRGRGDGYTRMLARLGGTYLRAFTGNQRLRVYWVKAIRKRLSA